MKILHIAPFNIAGVPIEFVLAERDLGHYSRLVTLSRDWRDYQEDICLELPWMDSPLLRFAKRFVSDRRVLQKRNVKEQIEQIPRIWRPKGWSERTLVAFRDWIWERKVQLFIEEHQLSDFDLYQLDGGLGFLRSGKIIRQLKQIGKKIVCCYLGSDLRLRGVIPTIDKVSDLDLTTEFDLQKLHPDIHHIFFPFNSQRFRIKTAENKVLRICHSPTDRQAKGSEQIIAVVKKLEKRYPVQLVLIENLTHAEALDIKAECDIMIDQLGELGYGISSLEALAMGIPTLTALTPEYAQYIPDHPFIRVDAENLEQKLIQVVTNREYRRGRGIAGRKWVEKSHDSRSVVAGILEIYREKGWMDQEGRFIG